MSCCSLTCLTSFSSPALFLCESDGGRRESGSTRRWGLGARHIVRTSRARGAYISPFDRLLGRVHEECESLREECEFLCEGEKNLGHLAPQTPFSQNTTSTARGQFRRSNSGSGVLGVGRVNATRGCGSAFAVLCHLCDDVCQNCMSQALRLSAPCGLASVPLS